MPETPQDLDGNPSAARMSVVLATDSYQTIRPVIKHLGLQAVRNQLEIVIIGPAGVSQDLDHSELQGFAAVRVVLVASLRPLGAARAAGCGQRAHR